MAAANASKAQSAITPSNGGAKALVDGDSAENFVVEQEVGGVSEGGAEGIYSAENCVNAQGQHIPVRGWITGVQPINHPEFGEKMCLAFSLTKPSAVSSNGKTRVQTRGRVLVPISLKLEELEAKATDPNMIYEYYVCPISKEKTSKGFKVTLWDIRLMNMMSREKYAEMLKDQAIKALAAASGNAAPALPGAAS